MADQQTELVPSTDPWRFTLPGLGIGGLLGGAEGALLGGLLGTAAGGLPERREVEQPPNLIYPVTPASAPPGTPAAPGFASPDIAQAVQAALEGHFAGRAEETEERERSQERLTGLTEDLDASQREQEQQIRDAIAAVNFAFDPVLSQFKTLFNEPVISADIERGLRSNIRSQSAISLADQERTLRQQGGARGLAGSSILARDLAQARQGTTAGRLGEENRLAAMVAELNDISRARGAQGLGQATAAQQTLTSGLEGLEIKTQEQAEALQSAIVNAQNQIGLGQDFTFPDLSGFQAADLALQFSEEDRAALEEAMASANNPLNLLGQGAAETLTQFLFKQFGA